jgi:hypothetical protein
MASVLERIGQLVIRSSTNGPQLAGNRACFSQMVKAFTDQMDLWANVRVVGVDAIALYKGRSKYVCVLVNLEIGQVLAMLEVRTQAVLTSYFRCLGGGATKPGSPLFGGLFKDVFPVEDLHRPLFPRTLVQRNGRRHQQPH